jgi:hypothetical protein
VEYGDTQTQLGIATEILYTLTLPSRIVPRLGVLPLTKIVFKGYERERREKKKQKDRVKISVHKMSYIEQSCVCVHITQKLV